MFFLRCRQCLHRQFAPRSSPVTWFGARHLHLRSTTQPVKPAILAGSPRFNVLLQTPFAQHFRRNIRLNSTSIPSRLDQDSITSAIHDDEARDIIARAKEVWPPPPLVPATWSCAWENWPYLLTFYWLSPYYLMLPQIEMVVNIRYRIPGETRPLLFSDGRESFVFTLVADNTRFFFFDCTTMELSTFDGVASEAELVRQMDEGLELMSMRRLEVDPEGEDAVRRILERDETVIPVLAGKFLDYTPEPTHPWEENPELDRELTDEEQIEEIKKLEEEMESKLGPAPDYPWEAEADAGGEPKRN